MPGLGKMRLMPKIPLIPKTRLMPKIRPWPMRKPKVVGEPFADCKWVLGQTGFIVLAIEAWTNEEDILCGLRLTFSDRSMSPIRGTASERAQKLVLDRGERIVRLTYETARDSSKVTWVAILTNKRQSISFGRKCISGGRKRCSKKSFDKEYESALLIGMTGTCTDQSLVTLDFTFLSHKVECIAVKNVQYSPNPHRTRMGIEDTPEYDTSYDNDCDECIGTYRCHGQRELEVSHNWTDCSWEEYGVPFVFKAPVFEIRSRHLGCFTWKSQEASRTSTSDREMKLFEWDWSGVLPPQERHWCMVTSQEGILELEYTADVTLFMSDNSEYTYSQRGTFISLVHTIQLVDIKDPLRVDDVGNPDPPRSTASKHIAGNDVPTDENNPWVLQ